MGFTGMTMSYLGITEALFMWKAVQYFHPSTPVSALWYGWVHPPFPLIDRWTYTTRCTPGYSAVEANYFWAGYFLEFIYCRHAAAHPLSIAHSHSHSLTPAWLGQAKLNRKKCGSQVSWIGTGRTWMDLRNVTVAIFPSFTPLHFTLPRLSCPVGHITHPPLPPSPCCLQLHVSQFTCEQLHYVVNQTQLAMWRNQSILVDLQQQQQQQATTTQMNIDNVINNKWWMWTMYCTHNGAFVVRAREPRPIQHTHNIHVWPIFTTTFKPLRALTVQTHSFTHTQTNTHIIVSKPYPSPGQSTLL